MSPRLSHMLDDLATADKTADGARDYLGLSLAYANSSRAET